MYWLVIFFVWFIPIEKDDFDQGDDFDNQVFDLIENIDFDVDDDIYIMMKCLSVCLFVTKNEHFLLGVSCNHLNPP